MGDKTTILISDDKGLKEPARPLEKDDDLEADEDLPDWLPDGWIMEVYRAADGTLNRYYTSPISDYTFTSQSDVLEYLFSGVDERVLESNECAAEMTLQSAHEWLPNGWVMEVRAGGKNLDKMYKFYVQERNGVRLQSKEDVLLYLKQSKISKCDTNGQCDISSEDNILAKVDLNPTGLPKGWVKELVFRKTKDRSIRKDPYYTDPTKGYTFRTLKCALSYLESGQVSTRAFIQKTSVHDIYSFDKYADLHEFLRSRLTVNTKPCRKRTGTLLPKMLIQIDHDGDTYSSEDGDTSIGSDSSSETDEENFNSMMGIGEEATSSKTIKHKGRKPQNLSEVIKTEAAEDEDAV